MSLGGSESVRGFRNNTLVRDSAVFASAELRVPVLQWSPVGNGRDGSAGLLEIAGFADYGFGANRVPATIVSTAEELTEIYSVGAGLRWAVLPDVRLELYGGYDLRNLEDPGEKDLQDYGIHFASSIDVAQAYHDLFD
jgi:hemolysin activation/secretion protein